MLYGRHMQELGHRVQVRDLFGVSDDADAYIVYQLAALIVFLVSGVVLDVVDSGGSCEWSDILSAQAQVQDSAKMLQRRFPRHPFHQWLQADAQSIQQFWRPV
jgi:hypothetical protein